MDGFLLLIIPYEKTCQVHLNHIFYYQYIFLNRAKINY